MVTACDGVRVPSHPPRPGMDAKHIAHLAGNDMTAEACGRAYPMLWTAAGVAALVRAFTM